MTMQMTVEGVQARGDDPLVWFRLPELSQRRIFTMRLSEITDSPPQNDSQRAAFVKATHEMEVDSYDGHWEVKGRLT